MGLIIKVFNLSENYLKGRMILRILKNNTRIQIVENINKLEELLDLIQIKNPDILIFQYFDIYKAINLIKLIKSLNQKCNYLLIGETINFVNMVSELFLNKISWISEKACEECLIYTIYSLKKNKFIFLSNNSFDEIKNDVLGINDGNHKFFMSLTAREIEVITLLAEGATNRTIGDVLFISENTVKTHVRNILEKLQLQSRTQAALYVYQKGKISSKLNNKKELNTILRYKKSVTI